MRLKLFFITCFIIISVNSFSQISIGFKNGLNFSNVKYDDLKTEKLIKDYKKIKSGVNLGIVSLYRMNPILSLQLEINYSQKGYKYNQIQYIKGKKKINYLEIPFFGKYKLNKSKINILNFYLGGFFAYMINGKDVFTEYPSTEKRTNKFDFNNPNYKYNRIDFGANIGFNFEYISKKRISQVDIRYTHSLVADSKEVADALLSRVFTISYSFLFSRKK